MAATEIENLNALRALLADLPEWISWTGLATTLERLDRIAAPELEDATALPAIAIDFGSASRVNQYGSDSSANFRPNGTMAISVFALDDETTGDTLTERYLDFAGKFFQLLDEIIENAFSSEIMVGYLAYPDQPIVRSPVNVQHVQDDNADGIDDAETVAVWSGVFTINWGGPPQS